MALGFERQDAARFSFLLAVPVILLGDAVLVVWAADLEHQLSLGGSLRSESSCPQ